MSVGQNILEAHMDEQIKALEAERDALLATVALLNKTCDAHAAYGDERIKALEAERDAWHKVVTECEYVFGCDDTADSGISSNLANLARDMKAERDEAAITAGRFLVLLHRAVGLIRDELLPCQNNDCKCREGFGVCCQCREAADRFLAEYVDQTEGGGG